MSDKKKASAVQHVEDQRLHVVEKIIEDMKKNGLRWAEPYLPTMTPHNPVTGTVYQGGNRIHLAFVGMERGFTDNRWCTFNQIRDNGWHLMKGAKSAIIEKWKAITVTDKNEDTGEEEITGQFLRLMGYWNVFNASEIEGMPSEVKPEHISDRSGSIASDLITSSRCPVNESAAYAGKAAYAPMLDRIMIAPRETFISDESFTRVLLHEMTHSTGHPSALGRTMNTQFGSPEYAKEELVAELGSLFLSADLGIQSADMEGEFYENHVAYLKSWVRALEDDPAYLFKASSQADKASVYLMERYENTIEQTRDEPELTQDKVSLRGEAAAMREAAGTQPFVIGTVPDLIQNDGCRE